MAQSRPDIVVRNKDVRKYFSNVEWRELSDYEKEQIRNVMRNYLVMTSIGFKAPLPFFVTDFEARRDQTSVEQKHSSSASLKVKDCNPKNEEATTRGKGHSSEEATTRGRGRPPKNAEAPTSGKGRPRPIKNEEAMTQGKGHSSKKEEATTSRRGRPPKNKEATTRGRGHPPKNKGVMNIKQDPKRASKIASKSLSKSDSKTPKPPSVPSSNPMPSKEIGPTRQQPPRLSKTAGVIFMKKSILASIRKYTFKRK
ncbi:histone-lysine N-methyltransferase PRDM9-like [Thrips palmi]|uniref:Histone-lysine N-methyltransferase PRDM9-like n=1 Tax=Thrips palmi TaxID=161013 RepID=A0A6P9A182_THRPL|nr:histone-lysine N-methyltransferase PRDM9-like [Thrips palmi]XP_034251517.1 histone-lysine N-methyltransferase PRDM9-like [Thrips palmi]